MKGGDQISGYFDIEKPRFALTRAGWLKIDEATGVLSGTPDAKGEVTVTAAIDRQVRELDEKRSCGAARRC